MSIPAARRAGKCNPGPGRSHKANREDRVVNFERTPIHGNGRVDRRDEDDWGDIGAGVVAGRIVVAFVVRFSAKMRNRLQSFWRRATGNRYQV
jgi:hypothetical protein